MNYASSVRQNSLGFFILLFILSCIELSVLEFEYIYSDSLTDQVEGLSCIFIVLNNFLFIIVSLLIYTIKSNKKQFIFLLVLLNILISASFYTKNILLFFMAFEAIVIPMGLIILL